MQLIGGHAVRSLGYLFLRRVGTNTAIFRKLGAAMLPDATYLRARGLQFRPLVLETGKNTPIFRKLGAAMLPDANYLRAHGLQFPPLVLETGQKYAHLQKSRRRNASACDLFAGTRFAVSATCFGDGEKICPSSEN